MIFYKLFRWFHKLYAELNGYFWTPCAMCGKPFGGHENTGGLYAGPNVWHGRGVCSHCHAEAEMITDNMRHANPDGDFRSDANAKADEFDYTKSQEFDLDLCLENLKRLQGYPPAIKETRIIALREDVLKHLLASRVLVRVPGSLDRYYIDARGLPYSDSVRCIATTLLKRNIAVQCQRDAGHTGDHLVCVLDKTRDAYYYEWGQK